MHVRAFPGLALLAALLFVSSGCPKRTQVSPVTDPAQGLQEALSDLDAKRYSSAQERLTFVIFNYPGSEQASDAQYYLAESYLQSGDYQQAETEFDFYLKSFPNGRFQEQATYKLALSYLRSAPGHTRDQTQAVKADELVDRFLDSYPESSLRPRAESLRADIEQRLALKEFDAARLYFKSGEYKSALVYYRYVLDHHPDARWTGRDRLQLGIAYLETGSIDKAREVLDAVATGDYEPSIKQQARDRIGRLN